MPATIRFQKSRMSGDPLVRFDEGRVGRTSVSPSLLLYCLRGRFTFSSIEVHRALGPGLLESAYIQCLCRELQIRQVPFVLEQPLPLIYKGLRLDCGYRVDLVVAYQVVVEVKVVDRIARVHKRRLR